MSFVSRIPVVKRLYPSLLKRWAALTWPHGYKVVKHRDALFLLHWGNHVDRKVALHGGHEEAQLDYLLAAMDKGCDLFLDIGANFGLYTLVMAKSGRAKTVHAFEPDPRNHAQLMGNLYLNKMADRVRVHALALSERAGMLTFDLYPSTSTGQTRVTDKADGVQLQALPLDEVLPVQGQRAVIKIDVEGHEFAVLSGARQFMTQNACLLQIELFPENANKVTALLNGMGYTAIHTVQDDHYFVNQAWRA